MSGIPGIDDQAQARIATMDVNFAGRSSGASPT
jgi:hypothetical protein